MTENAFVFAITISYVVNKSETLDKRNSVLDNQHIVVLLIKLLLTVFNLDGKYIV